LQASGKLFLDHSGEFFDAATMTSLSDTKNEVFFPVDANLQRMLLFSHSLGQLQTFRIKKI